VVEADDPLKQSKTEEYSLQLHLPVGGQVAVAWRGFGVG